MLPSRTLCRRRLAANVGAACAAVALGATGVSMAGGTSSSHAVSARTSCSVPGAREPLDRIWHPDVAAAIGFARRRSGDIAFAVRTGRRFYGYRADHVEWSASVVKAMLMVAYLDRRSVAARRVNAYDVSLLIPMITRSDNTAASTVDGIVGDDGLRALAARVGMTHFTPISAPAGPWGETRITAQDQTKFFLHLDSFVVPRHRGFAMHLLASITPSQRWGIGEIAPPGWQLYFKGGWGSGTGLVDHQVVLLKRGCARVSLAVLSMYDRSHLYGKATLRGIFARLLHGFPSGAPLYPVAEAAHYRTRLSVSSSAPTVDFSTGNAGQLIHRFTLRIPPLAHDPCTATVLPHRYGWGTISVTPAGKFAARKTVGRYRVGLAGGFLPRRRAAGTLTEEMRDGTSHRISCTFTARWSASSS